MKNVALGSRTGARIGSGSWAVVATAAALVACQGGTGPSGPDVGDVDVQPEAPTVSGRALVGPERAIDVVQHAVLAFRSERGKQIGGYRTHRAEINSGIVELTPYRFDRSERVAGDALVLETTAITVDDGLLAGGADATRVEGDTVIVTRGPVEEHLRNEAEGLRQEWHFPEAPGLSGDLVVEVTVAGQAFTGRTDGGLHFMSDDGVGVRYSHAIWIDAAGGEWPIEARYADGRIAMTVPESILAETQFPAVLDPTVGAEVAADAPVVGFTGANSQNPAIAFDGTNYLVVWEDNRNSADSDIWATRISAAGAILDPLGLEIANGAGRQVNPTVAFDGTRYVVAWQDFKVAGGTDADIDAATVTTAGAITQLAAVAATANSETVPTLAGRPGGALLVWTANSDVLGSAFSGAFAAPFSVAATAAVEADPTVTANPAGDYLVLWSEGAAATADLRGQLVTSAGALSGAAITVSAAAGQQYNPAAAFDGANFATVWTNNSAGINLYGARVSTAGVVLDTRVEATVTVGGVAISTATNNQEFPTVACLVSGCFVAWQDRRNVPTTGFDLYGQVLNPDFSLNGTELVLSSASLNQLAPAIVASASAFYLVWHDNRDTNALSVFGATISTTGVVGAQASLVGGNNRESGPRLGRAGGTFGVFWSDSRSYGNDIAAVRFNGNGTKLDSTARLVSTAVGAQVSPAGSTDLGANTLVVWSDGRSGIGKDIYAARFNTGTGVVIDTNGIAITTATADQLVPDVASNGTVALIVWQDRRNGGFDIYGALVASAGTVVTPDIVISNATADQNRPAVTYDPTSAQFIVVWSDNRSGAADIYGARVTTAGVVLDTTGVAVSAAVNGQFTPAIASTSTTTMAVWEDRRTEQDVYGTRLSGGASLSVLNPAGIAVSTVAGAQSAPKITSLGTSLMAAWVDGRISQNDIYGQQISTSGLLAGTEFAIANSPNTENGIAVLGSGTANSARVAYETTRPDLSTVRVNTRVVSFTTGGANNGVACTTAAQCASGFCTDGYCCDTACGAGSTTDCQACSFNKTLQPNGTCSPVASGTICRNYANTFCDLREYCNGVSTACPSDIGRNQGLVCNSTTGAVCPSNAAPGPHSCP